MRFASLAATAILLAAASLLATRPAAAAGFDCGKAASPTEKAICADPALSAADGAMSRAFRAARGLELPQPGPESLAAQRDWNAARTQDCGSDTACLMQRTEARIQALHEAQDAGFERLSEGDAAPAACTQPAVPENGLDDQAGLWRLLNGQSAPKPQYSTWEQGNGAQWSAAVKDVTGADAEDLNLYDCATAYPASVLRERARLLGSNHPYIASFIRMQTAVLKLCGSYERDADALAALPHETDSYPSAQIARLAQADRAYQQASALFYGRQWDAANEAFGAIAAGDSPHAHTARYMQARVLYDREQYPQAAAELQKIVADPKLKDIHGYALSLLHAVSYQTADRDLLERQVRDIAAMLALPDSALSDGVTVDRLGEAAGDIDHILAQGNAGLDADWRFSDAPLGEDPRAAAVKAVAADTESIDWLTTLYTLSRETSPPAMGVTPTKAPLTAAHALQRWQETGSLAWAVAAWRGVGAQTPEPARRALLDVFLDLDARARRCGLSPAEQLAWTQMAPQVVRLLAGGNPYAPLAPVLALLKGRADMPGKETQQALVEEAVKLLVASGRDRDAHSLMQAAPVELQPALSMRLATDEATWLAAAAKDEYTAMPVLNAMPIAVLARLAKDSPLPEDMRRTLARAAWTRAILLDRTAEADALLPLLGKLDPALGDDIASIEAAGSSHARELQIVHLIAMHPRMSIIAYKDDGSDYGSGQDAEAADAIDIYQHSLRNWWCTAQPTEMEKGARQAGVWSLSYAHSDVGAIGDEGRAGLALPDSHPTIRQIDRAELEALAQQPNGPRWVAQKLLAFDKDRSTWERWTGDETLLADTMARGVTMTRYGCQMDGGYHDPSRALWMALHKDFPDSQATADTPYWFDCAHFSYGCGKPPAAEDGDSAQ